LWDATNQDNVSKPLPNGYLTVRIDGGLFDIASLRAETQALTVLRGRKIQFGNVRGAAKFTLPTNRDLRLVGPAIEIGGVYSFLGEFNSLGGFRVGGTGYSPTGIIVKGFSIEAKALTDIDFITIFSWLPIKLMINAGARIPTDRAYLQLAQYIAAAGVAYSGVNVDVFAEYCVEGVFNSNTDPKIHDFPAGKKWEVAFSENPMYLTIGGRYRYPSGMVLYAAVPLLLSWNKGSTMEFEGGTLPQEEKDRDITDGFDPWFAKWKLALQMTYPIRYTVSAAEMRRNFFLLKNRKDGKKIDIDERLKAIGQQGAPDGQQLDGDGEEGLSEQERLEAIRKRQKEAEGSK
jgi:hypothetical protein